MKKTWLQKALFFLIGFSLPIILSFLYYFSKGALIEYIRACFFQNVGYLSSWKGQSGIFQGQGRLLIRMAVLSISVLFLYFKRKTFSKNFLFLTLWFLFSLFAVLLSERPYPHYLIQVLPALVLLLGLGFKAKLKERLFILLAFCLLFFSYRFFHFYTYPVFSFFQNYFAFISGQKNKEVYFKTFDAKTFQTYQIAFYLKTHTLRDERVFIWGDEPGVHALADRLPPGKYMVAYHVVHFNGFEETMTSLREKMPKIIIKMSDENRSFEELDIFLKQFYLKVTHVDQAEIYYQITP